jgi:hypothetical protein
MERPRAELGAAEIRVIIAAVMAGLAEKQSCLSLASQAAERVHYKERVFLLQLGLAVLAVLAVLALMDLDSLRTAVLEEMAPRELP